MRKAGNMDKFFITTGRKIDEKSYKKAQQLAEKCQMPFVERDGKSLEQLKIAQQLDKILLVKKTKIVIVTAVGELFFHPNMAQLRIKKLLKKEPDNMIEAMGLKAGMTVLDCTLGFAADALVSSFISKIQVVGLEADELLSLVISDGLKNYNSGITAMDEAMRNIKVININHKDYLRQLPDDSFDIVYFDPMFRHPLQDSIHLQPLRQLADISAVDAESIAQARRVARKKIIFKENSKSREFSRLGFTKIAGGRYSNVHYGVMDI